MSNSHVGSSGCMQPQGTQYYVERAGADGHSPISGLQYDNTTDTGDPGAQLFALAGHLGPRAHLYSHHKPLIDHLVSLPIYCMIMRTRHVLNNAVHTTKETKCPLHKYSICQTGVYLMDFHRTFAKSPKMFSSFQNILNMCPISTGGLFC